MLERAANLNENPNSLSPQDAQNLVHELQLQQIELEMQNEELRRTRAELETANSRHLDLYDRAPVGYCSVNDDGLIKQANRTTAFMLGTLRHALRGKPFSRFIEPEDQDVFYLFRRKLLDTRRSLCCELRLLHADGTTFWGNLSGMAVSHDDGSAALRLVLSDITERKQFEEGLRRSQAMLARTESFAHIGSWEWDVATDTVTWSDELFRIFRRNPANGAPSLDEHEQLYVAQDIPQLKAAVEATIGHGTPYEMELRAIRQDGETRVCLARGYAEMGSEQRVTRLFGSLGGVKK